MYPDPPDRSSARTDAVRGIVVLLVVVVGLAVFFWDGAAGDATEADPATALPSATASSGPTRSVAPTTTAPPTRNQARMPDLAGVRLDAATEQLSDLGRATGVDIGHPSSHDLSPRDRSQWADGNWTVVTTRPAAGRPVMDGTDLVGVRASPGG
ncbi:hypothetical protein FHU33_1523 [Blastococcus colisei]|uniref:PASTA domain-containing protein n=1 Tax=Blastococcus colisei TaxID=1564162 RepID=A0A543PDK0_9ACTN|nr:hypothetical protein [Blastococcus colisei]TQN42129.1 hypothetical protein FHU33_1523 [Blastococcus colisei]